ncbi:trypsin-like serine protease [Halorhabdus sp. CUG00001]|uniref:trypsin-like serine protease n=1 Tax=Halorhabdus sp. CUG00001 TaxID=2600297 RepID=UPI00131B29C1|nr:trypsin-like serine protease [Halorhabdus sp. CUG00001]
MLDKSGDCYSRRSFIKQLSTATVVTSFSTALSGQVVSAKQEDTSENIKYVSSFEREITEEGELVTDKIYKTIDQNRLARINAVNNAIKGLQEKVTKEFGSDAQIDVRTKVLQTDRTSAERGISIQLTTEKLVREPSQRKKDDLMTQSSENKREENSHRVKEPSVSIEDVEQIVPGKVSGRSQVHSTTHKFNSIPVEVESKTLKQTAKFNDTYRPIPGGCQITHYDGIWPWDSKQATTGARAWDNNGEHQTVMTTAGHAMEESDGNIRQPTGSTIGSPERYKNDQSGNERYDFGFFSINSNASTTDKLARKSGETTSMGINGCHTWEWIEREGPTANIEKKGRTTGNTSGSVIGTDAEDNQVQIDATQKDGDSGGPMYHEDGSGYKLVGLASWELSGKGYGNAAETIENKLDVSFF